MLTWYITLTLLGLLTFPLTYRLFPALVDRGYALARTAGLLIWAFAFWMLASLGLAQNDLGGILLGLAVLTGLSVWALIDRGQKKDDETSVYGLESLLDWLKTNWRTVVTVELLFLVAFAFMAFVRSANPDIDGTEKPMELAFINAILRSPTFPPNDPWLSGYSISYYHFGYIMTAMLAKLTSTPGSVAFNLMLALVFALSAIGAYGIVYNLLAVTSDRKPEAEDRPRSSVIGLPLLGPLFLLFVSNIEGFLEVLYKRGLFWTDNPASSNFWIWLNMKDLNQAPDSLPGKLWPQLVHWVQTEGFLKGFNLWFAEQFEPARYWWWWRASRVIQDFNLAGNWNEVIDEFPMFSFVLGDLHPHVLAIPFGMLAIGVALNLFAQRQESGIFIFDLPLRLRKIDFLFAALVLGGMAFINTWDILPYAALMVVAYVAARILADGWRWERIEDAFGFGLPLGVLSLLLYLPFYLGFSSQAGGILPNLTTPARGIHLWVMFGTLFVPLFAWLIFQLRGQKSNWTVGIVSTIGVVLLLWALSWLLGWVATRVAPEVALSEMISQGAADFASYFKAASLRRLSYIGSLLTLMALLAPTIALLTKRQVEGETLEPVHEQPSPAQPLSTFFVLLLILIGGLLILAPEFVYLRDQFGTRMNTIFKFYYQAWMLLSLAAAFGAATLLRNLRGLADWLWRITLILVLIIGLTYPLLALPNKTNDFNPSAGRTLDGAAFIERGHPEDAAAIHFLQTVPLGVIAEATSPRGNYSYYARISTHTGLPTVLGWPGHEGQWRGSYAPQGTRDADMETLYTTPTWVTAEQLIKRYNIRYIVVGSLERTTYKVSEEKFQRFLQPIFQLGTTTVYLVP